MTKQSEEEIVFEDLHGTRDDAGTDVQVDLDAEEGGITRHARIVPDDDGGGSADNDDSNQNRRQPKADDGDDGSDEDTGDRFSKKFEARLKREQRAKRRERERAEDAEARADAAELALRKANRAPKTDKADLDRQVADVEAELTKAIDTGEPKEQVRLTSQLTDLKARRLAADFETGDDDDDPDEPARRPPAKKNDALDDWMDERSDWFQRRGFEKQTRAANRIDKKLYAEGYDPFDPDYFEEMDRRIKKDFPDLYDDAADDGGTDDDDDGNRRNRRQPSANRNKRSPVADAGDGGNDTQTRRQAKSSEVNLDAADFANMRRFGLNVDDPAVLKEYALNKRQRMLEEAEQ